MKVNLSTPPSQIWQTMHTEAEKAVRWYNKHQNKAGGDERLRKDAIRRMLDDPTHASQVVFQQTWDSSQDPEQRNRWLCFEAIAYLAPQVQVEHGVQAIYYETEGSIGAFLFYDNDTDEDINDAGGTLIARKHILCFTSHFFLRYCDPDTRNLGTMHQDRTQVIIDFIKRNRHGISPLMMRQYTDSGNDYIDICLSGCVGRGKVRRDSTDIVMYEFDTCLSWPMLHRKQYYEVKPVLDAYKQHIKELNEQAADMAEQSTGSHAYLLEDLEHKYIERTDIDRSTTYRQQLYSTTRYLRDYLAQLFTIYTNTPHTPHTPATVPDASASGPTTDTQYTPTDIYTALSDVSFYVDQAKRVTNKGIKKGCDITEFNDIMERALIYCCWHYNIDLPEDEIRHWFRTECCGEQVAGSNPLTPITQHPSPITNRINNNNMNSAQQQELKRVLKDNGVKNFNSLPSVFGLNSGKYLDLAEPIYVISRLMPYVNSDNDRQKMLAAQKAWINIVVEREWCSALKPYTDKYGKTLVAMAIEYCIDNNVWQSPKGNSALRTHQDDHYKGLDCINDAVLYFQSEGITDTANTPNTPATVSEALASDPITSPQPDMTEPTTQRQYNADITDTSAATVPTASAVGSSTPLVEFVDTDNENTPTDCFNAFDKGINVLESIEKAERQLASLLSYLEDNKDTSLADLQRTIDRQRTQIQSLEATLSSRKDEILSIKQDLQRAKDERNEVQQNYNKKSQDYDRIVKVKRDQAEIIKAQGEELKNLRTSLDETTEALNRLKEQQASFAALPKRKIWRMSDLLNIPFVGKGTILAMKPFYEKNNIFIDESK